MNFRTREAVTWRCSVKNMFLKISWENTGDRVSLKRDSSNGVFPRNLRDFLERLLEQLYY